MLRLAHRMLLPTAQVTGWCQESQRLQNESIARNHRRMLIGLPVIIADAVAEWYYAHEKIEWDINDDIPNVAPPFDCFFVEWSVPKILNMLEGRRENTGSKQFGFMVSSFSAESTESENLLKSYGEKLPECFAGKTSSRWLVIAQPWIAVSEGGMYATFLASSIFAYVTEVGKIASYGALFSSTDEQLGRFALELYTPLLLTISFIHCKNVITEDATQTEGPSEKWLRRMKQPKLRYHVLNIEPMKQALRTEGGVEQNGLKKALHICRGHFATYTDEKPLFGRVTGTFWKPAHVRGSIEQGAVVKDYNVKSPVTRTEP